MYRKWLCSLSPETGVSQRCVLILLGDVGVALPVDHIKDQTGLLLVSITFLTATTKRLMKVAVSIPSGLTVGKALLGLIVREFSPFCWRRNGGHGWLQLRLSECGTVVTLYPERGGRERRMLAFGSVFRLEPSLGVSVGAVCVWMRGTQGCGFRFYPPEAKACSPLMASL